MKLKQQPDDFRVEELTEAGPTTGPFAFYRLAKVGWTTPDAIAAIRRRWQVDAGRLSYGGLKDRHADTTQHITIRNGPKRDLTHQRITLTYLGQRPFPFTSRDIRANRFTVVMRSLSPEEIRRAEQAAAEVGAAHIPNYFDDQRFGSVGGQREFVARELVFGRFEQALRLALVASYEFDRADSKREKAVLTEHWGDWPTCKAALPRGHARSLVDYLVTHPTDFKGAVARLRPDLHGLYLSAYQSDLWNRMLAAWLRRHIPVADRVEIDLKLGPVPVPARIPNDKRAAWEALTLPLPSARLKPQPDSDWLPLVEEVLAAEGLTLNQMRIKGMQKPFFSKGDRPGMVHPAGLMAVAEPDDRHLGRMKMTLRFELPRGSYATMLVKRLAQTRDVADE